MMTDLPPMATQLIKAQRSLQKSAGVGIEYREGEHLVEGIKAVPGTSKIPIIEQGASFGLIFEAQDFLIVVTDLVADDTQLIPKRGATITAMGCVWTVANPNKSEAPFRYSDPFRQIYRIHTVNTGIAPS